MVGNSKNQNYWGYVSPRDLQPCREGISKYEKKLPIKLIDLFQNLQPRPQVYGAGPARYMIPETVPSTVGPPNALATRCPYPTRYILGPTHKPVRSRLYFMYLDKLH